MTDKHTEKAQERIDELRDAKEQHMKEATFDQWFKENQAILEQDAPEEY